MISNQLPAAIRRKWRRTIAETRYGYYNKLTRRGGRLACRFLLVIVLFIIVFTFHDSTKPEENRVMRREIVREQLARRLGPKSNDLRTWPGWTGVKTIFAFGDSQTDTGFNLRGPQPDEENPLGNPAFPGRTSTYRANYLGHMTATYNQSFIKTYNMANKFSPFFHNTETMKMPSFGEQIENKFLRRYGPSTKMTMRSSRGSGSWSRVETLFILYVGADDVMQSFGDELESKGTVGMEENIAAYMKGIQKLYEAGARNFLMVLYPKLEDAPGIKAYGDKAGESKAYWRLGASIVQYNARLAFAAHLFADSHPDANFFAFNSYKVSLTVRLEPTRYPETAMYNHLYGYCFPYAEDHWWTDTAGVFDPICTDGLINYLWRDEFHLFRTIQQTLG